MGVSKAGGEGELSPSRRNQDSEACWWLVLTKGHTGQATCTRQGGVTGLDHHLGSAPKAASTQQLPRYMRDQVLPEVH